MQIVINGLSEQISLEQPVGLHSVSGDEEAKTDIDGLADDDSGFVGVESGVVVVWDDFIANNITTKINTPIATIMTILFIFYMLK